MASAGGRADDRIPRNTRVDDAAEASASTEVATLPNAATSVTISAAASATELTVNWSTDANASDTRYQIDLALDSGFTNGVITSTT